MTRRRSPLTLPMRFWQGNRQYMIRAAPCGHRFIGSCDGEDIAMSSDPAVVVKVLIAVSKTRRKTS